MKKLSAFILVLLSNLSCLAQDFSGIWSGRLDVGAMQLNLVFNIEKGDDGKLSGSMDSPDQGAKGIPVEVEIKENSKMEIRIPSIGGAFNGVPDGNGIKGTFTQQGYSFPLNLKRGGIGRNRPQEPTEPYPYKTEEVTFVNTTDKATLSGTLTYPVDFDKKKKGSVPVVVMVTGSGLQNRDEELFGHKPFLVIADYLARNGIASLRYDDRGAGKSVGDADNATTENFMNDALAGLGFVRKSGLFGKAGIIGHSEGGLISFMIGARGKADFIVSMAGAGIAGDSILIEQNDMLLRLSMVSPDVRSSYCRALRMLYDNVKNPTGTETPEETVKKITGNPGVKLPAGAEQNLVAIIKGMTPWLRYFISYDPSADIKAVKCPVLAINGTNDTQVLAASNLGAIRKLLPADKRNRVKEYPSLNHLFQHCTTGMPTEYGRIEETISPEVLKDIADWIKTVAE